jgi:hypothetical protein
LQVIALKTHDVSDQQLPVLCGHPNESGVDTIRIAWGLDGIDPQHFDGRFEEHLLREEQCDREDFTGPVDRGDRHTDTAATDVDGLLGELTLSAVRLGLNADGQHNGDSIIFAAISPGRL